MEENKAIPPSAGENPLLTPSGPPSNASQEVTDKPDSLDRGDAYLQRKKGRKLHRESYEDAKKLFESIQRRGEAAPGDLAEEFGMARSSLAYNLNRLVDKGYIVRIGGGRSIRYRPTGIPLGRIN